MSDASTRDPAGGSSPPSPPPSGGSVSSGKGGSSTSGPSGATGTPAYKSVSLSDLTKPTADFDSWGGAKPTKEAGQLQWLRKVSLIVYASTGSSGSSGSASSSGKSGSGSAGGKAVDTRDPAGGSSATPTSRAATTSVSDNKGQSSGIDLSNMRIDFRLNKQTNRTPNFLQAKVYNLSRETIQKVGQFNRVMLSAGYQSNYGVIFDGTVVLYIVGKENPVDSYIQIIAGDGDDQLSNLTVNLTFPPGTRPETQVKIALQQANVTEGKVDLGKGQQPTLRYTHYIGSLWRFIRGHTNATSSDFFIDDGKAYVIPTLGYREGQIVDLSPTTGLVGIPKVTPEGIEAICLMNPKLRIAGLCHIDSQLLTEVPFYPGGKAFAQAAGFPLIPKTYTKAAATVAPTGVYKILQLNHYGDTRGTPWYSEIVGIASGADGKELPNAVAGTAFKRSAAGFATGSAAAPASPPPPPPPASPPPPPPPPPASPPPPPSPLALGR